MAKSTLRLPKAQKWLYPEVAWEEMRELYNMLKHDSREQVDNSVIMEVIDFDLALLAQAVQDMLDEAEEE